MPTENVLLRTPCAAETEGGPLHPDTARERGQTLRLTGQVLAMTGDLLPTPRASDGPNGGPNMRGSKGDKPLPAAVMDLLPTPRTTDMNGLGRHGDGGADLRTTVVEFLPAVQKFGDYTPAIRRHELAMGRPAPDPTLPTGRGGAHRLSSRFVEWMMMLPAGWVTDCELSRSAELRILGNGVVPAQATAALTEMRAVFENRAAQAV